MCSLGFSYRQHPECPPLESFPQNKKNKMNTIIIIHIQLEFELSLLFPGQL